MPKSIIVEGKTTAEALEKGLKELNVSKNMVEVKQIEEKEKRSFYSILSPRVVKLEITVKEEAEKREEKKERKAKKMEDNPEVLEKASESAKEFLNKFLPKDMNYEVKVEDSCVFVYIDGENVNHLIGYRGETMNALQTLMSVIVNKNQNDKVRLIVDVGGYKDKRKKTLEDLAEKVAKTVIRTRKSITLEPMTAFERKIIHTALQNNSKVETYSKGEEPYRRLVIALK